MTRNLLLFLNGDRKRRWGTHASGLFRTSVRGEAQSGLSLDKFIHGGLFGARIGCIGTKFPRWRCVSDGEMASGLTQIIEPVL